ncbi:TPA: carbamoyl-phosphate synthase (glutamine-hydrolyzing) large subunit [Candidatus Woesearchaeota archaeon]|nr:carbamoyl-phosphate synthase (glutamine-hydrolyzing) large subunit [Candidatus Woesearchaeota archaeon]HIH42400.1 carbamoyl-phosphate synthase (glutamine-hydrolyzing) large subunit [Candidatus Woesearchaeota archaeon]
MQKPKKILVIGSGALMIGQAGEFDFSASQCLKSLKEEQIETVLINPNIATIQTSEGMADKIYFLPITPYFVEKIIEKEKPEGILLSFGGQTALNCGLDLDKAGVFARYGVQVLGTPVKSIRDTEDRELFVKKLQEINVKTAKSFAVRNVADALKAAQQIGYPVMVRSGFSLGGRGSGVVYDETEIFETSQKALANVEQILIEEYLGSWKEIEYEVVRDCYDNCITVCNMENFDPMGIHTGESIVVAPSQTLDNNEYHMLREISLKVIRHLGIIGECNIQYALHPESREYRVIEVNARLSRSSALASKATGYPLAFVAAKLALGYSLLEIKNNITKITTACFEPALDYIVVKIPRWDLKKFKDVDKRIGSEMKSVGEVMAIGRCFEETIQKAIRMLNIQAEGLVCNGNEFTEFNDIKDIRNALKHPTDRRIFAIVEAMKQEIPIDEIALLTGIDKFFLYKIMNIIKMEKRLCEDILTPELLMQAKKIGFSDKQIGILLHKEEAEICTYRMQHKIMPFIKQIDTLAAEYPAQTNYLYLTYNANEHDITPSSGTNNNSVLVLGSGAYRIGSSVEFDWCCVSCVKALKKIGKETIMINCNPETVSTDYDECDRLYFEELTLETVMQIHYFEKPYCVIISMGGQIPNNLAIDLYKNNIHILGTSAENIDCAEDRHKFSKLLDRLQIEQPQWIETASITEAKKFAEAVTYPILIRPSYVLSGAAMNVLYNEEYLDIYLREAVALNPKHPVVITKFIEHAKEIEIDAVAQNGEIIIFAISEHIEHAGVHSGDATMVLPCQKIYVETSRKIEDYARKIAKALEITGPFNIQFLAQDNYVKVIECNLRASRSFPFCSKVTNYNFIDIATKVMLREFGMNVEYIGDATKDINYVGVKAAQFSFSRLKKTDPVVGVEMRSTGEAACFGNDIDEALLKSLAATGFSIPQKSILVSISGDKNRFRLINELRRLYENGYLLYATEHTSAFLTANGIANYRLYKIQDKIEPNVLSYIRQQRVDLVISMPEESEGELKTDSFIIRRTAIDFSVPLINNVQLAKAVIDAILRKKQEELLPLALDEYVPKRTIVNN